MEIDSAKRAGARSYESHREGNQLQLYSANERLRVVNFLSFGIRVTRMKLCTHVQKKEERKRSRNENNSDK